MPAVPASSSALCHVLAHQCLQVMRKHMIVLLALSCDVDTAWSLRHSETGAFQQAACAAAVYGALHMQHMQPQSLLYH